LVNHGALSQSRVYELLCSKDERVRRAAFILLETSNPTLRRNSEVFLEIIRFIWNANPNYDVYREFSKRHLLVPYKVHELISARLKIENESNRAHFSISAPNLGANVRADFLRDCFGVARLRKRWMRWSQ
jgi:hypothetical protein